jgi:hypothetical protein
MDALNLQDGRGPRPRWTLVNLRALPEDFWRAAVGTARDAASREHLALDLEGFVPAAAAVLDLQDCTVGEGAVDMRRWRGVGSVRLGGAPALLGAEGDVPDHESLDTALVVGAVRGHLVTRARLEDATRVAVAERAGLRI